MLLVRRLASCSRRVHIRLLLSLHNVLLVSDSLVAEPVTDLGHRDAALASKLLLHLEGTDWNFLILSLYAPRLLDTDLKDWRRNIRSISRSTLLCDSVGFSERRETETVRSSRLRTRIASTGFGLW